MFSGAEPFLQNYDGCTMDKMDHNSGQDGSQ